jgi:hypothetical protein
LLAGIDHLLRRFPGFLREDLPDHDGIRIEPIDDSPRNLFVGNPQFVATAADGRHRAGVRQSKILASLQLPQQHARFNPRVFGKRGRFDFPFQSYQRLVDAVHS